MIRWMRASCFGRTIAVTLFLLLPWSASAQTTGEAQPHRLVIQVNTNDPELMTLALNNVVNLSAHYNETGEDYEMEIVTYGPGVHMLRADTSPVKERIKSVGQSIPNVSFTACGNTLDAMKKAEGKEIPLLPGVNRVQTGVARIVELQEQGWSYIRP